jgi:hypothetical protein
MTNKATTKKATKEKISRPRIDEAKFIRVWAQVHKRGGHLQDVADELGASYPGVSLKAKKLLEEGIPLPALPRAPRKSNRDVGQLKDILKSELSKK